MKELEVHCNRGWRQAIDVAPPFVRGRRQSAAHPAFIRCLVGPGSLPPLIRLGKALGAGKITGSSSPRPPPPSAPFENGACGRSRQSLRQRLVGHGRMPGPPGYQPASGLNRSQLELIDAASKTQEVPRRANHLVYAHLPTAWERHAFVASRMSSPRNTPCPGPNLLQNPLSSNAK
jgi:hypothetical protein